MVAVALGCLVAGAMVGAGALAVIRRLQRAGLSRCVLCEGVGYYRDATAEHQAREAERLGVND